MKGKRSRDQRRVDTNERHKRLNEEIDAINERLNTIATNKFQDPEVADRKEFDALPIFQSTKDALRANKFVKMSPIQEQSLLYSLCGKDLIGASETGTGKTLAFLIPIIEILKRNKWGPQSGLGALIISPTRDLAAQTFNVLKDLIAEDNLSCGLVTGGLNFEEEQMGLERLNVIICTVGRLKEHMENSPTFNADQLQMLVLDEADRLLGTGFMKDLKQIIQELPSHRQTLLFTATANKAIRELSKVSLKSPVHVLITEKRESATPDNLLQFYAVVPLAEKLNTLFSFLKAHKSDKIIVFMETVKMVRFVFESFRHLKPGIPLLHLTGKQSSELRFSVCRQFAEKDRAVIFTTDVAARGLDFPQVNWVVQMDCPTSLDTYIHRVGRTARFYQGGKGFLFLTPSEKAFVDKLTAGKVPIVAKQIDSNGLFTIRPDLVDILAKFSEVKHLAVKAFTTYIKSVQRHNDGEVFKLDEVLAEKDEFARAFGLLGTPVVVKGKKSASVKESDDEDVEFYSIVEHSGDETETASQPQIAPEHIPFLTPDTEVPDEEYQGWRSYLRNLLEDGKQKGEGKKKKHQKADEEGEQPVSLEQAAEALFMEDF